MYNVQSLLKKRKRKGVTEYYVQWGGGYEPTWEPEENIMADLVKEFKPKKKPKRKL